jgi:hypothetical protein
VIVGGLVGTVEAHRRKARIVEFRPEIRAGELLEQDADRAADASLQVLGERERRGKLAQFDLGRAVRRPTGAYREEERAVPRIGKHVLAGAELHRGADAQRRVLGDRLGVLHIGQLQRAETGIRAARALE